MTVCMTIRSGGARAGGDRHPILPLAAHIGIRRGLYTILGGLSSAVRGGARELPICCGDAEKLLRLEARAPHQRSIHIADPQQVLGVVRLDGTAVKDPDA